MDIFHMADIHGRAEFPEGVLKAMGDSDWVLISGDITHFGHYEDAEAIISGLLEYNHNLLAVTGNCDNSSVRDFLEEKGFNLEGRGLELGEVGIFGTGGSGPTPFNTPNEKGEEEIQKEIEAGYGSVSDCEVVILLSHTPPVGTACDITGSGVHAGSSAVRDFIEVNRLDYCLCGHIHEARSVDRLGGAMIVNPGPTHMGYAKIDTRKGRVELL